MSILQLLLYCGAAALMVSLGLVVTQAWHGHLSYDSAMGVQKAHVDPTPRVGGIALALGLCVAVLLAPPALGGLLLPLMLAAVPAFAMGLWEDVTKRVPVPTRLAATMASGFLAWWLMDTSLTRVNVPGFDLLLAWLPFSVLFTAFAVAGAANAFNIIDGFNGLAAGVGLICLAALAAMAAAVGDAGLHDLCLVVASVVVGFWLVNFPLGKIFLGDGGAYGLGFVIGWVAVLLPMRNSAVSVWATLLVCAYPILETLFSIVRRHRRRGSPGAADRLHLHSLVQRRLMRRWIPGGSRLVLNSATGAFMWLVGLGPALLALQWPGNSAVLATSFGLSALAYSAMYARLTQFRWCISPATLAPGAAQAG
jgi:UDP-N-acetylmuramyl pentapeptide phosphotransferase/UDP-N-acetylglucosamine-1-phosphate transferase